MKFLVLALCIFCVSANPHWDNLDEEEIASIKRTWNEVKSKEIEILYHIFKDHPDIMSKFPQFSGKELEELKRTSQFGIHVTRIVSFFSHYILLLGRESSKPCLRTITNDMAEVHKTRGVTKDDFNKFKDSIFKYLKDHVEMDKKVIHAWNDCFDSMYYVIFSNYDGKPVS
ncbi:unnamed protein product [Chironomus riparius]|uniref:Globin 2 n=1 Tax=Chironomus riparius TaxID=315576 RepID=A0A158USK6_9DIPT|nr:globin 2 [Chironomus riparius]CAG9801269.1 unnamed protein product [Chironomus riparius]